MLGISASLTCLSVTCVGVRERLATVKRSVGHGRCHDGFETRERTRERRRCRARAPISGAFKTQRVTLFFSRVSSGESEKQFPEGARGKARQGSNTHRVGHEERRYVCGRVRSCVDVRDADEDVARVCRKRPRRDVNARAFVDEESSQMDFFFPLPEEMLAKPGERRPVNYKLFLSKGTRATQRAPPALE